MIDAVVVHWNQGDACAETIARLAAEPLVGVVVVVDNGSRSAERAAVKRAISESTPSITLIEVGANIGFGPATNRGWQHWLSSRTTEWCLALPHDAYAKPGALQSLFEIASANSNLGLLSADVGDGMVPIVDRNFGPIFRPQVTESGLEPCDYPHGTMFMARRACLEEIGLYDEEYFTYCEEADLGLRAKAAGWDVGLARGARVVNPRVSSPRAVAGYLMERNTLLLVRKHFGLGPAVVRTTMALGQLAARVFRPSSRTEYWSARSHALAIWHGVLGKGGPPPGSL